MSIHRRNAKRDKNEASIVRALRSIPGCTVSELSGEGVPDLLVGFQGKNHLLEVKNAKGKLTEAQIKWHEEWTGTAHVVRSVNDALNILDIQT